MSRTQIIKKHFTLVEILVALAIFMLAIAPLLGLLMKTTGVHTDNLKRIKAQMLAKDELARLTLYKRDSAFNSNTASMTVTSRKHPKYTGLYYKVESEASPPFNLAIFNLFIGYKRNTWDETYQIYVARDE
jgi:hypothetical protein